MPNGPRRPGPTPSPERDGADPAWRPSRGYFVVAAGLVAAGLAYGLMSSPSSPSGAGEAGAGGRTAPAASSFGADRAAPNPAPLPMAAGTARSDGGAAQPKGAPAAPPPGTPATGSSLDPAAAATIPRQRDPNGDPTPDLADYVNAGEQPTMGEVIDRLHQAGVRSGLGAFAPPGTRPPLIGLAVPDDYVLPDGYVRHHQATDDGQRIEAILMFAPDRPVVDAQGRPVAVPPDRVVPPELAPPGLPIRRIVVPAPAEPRRPGR